MADLRAGLIGTVFGHHAAPDSVFLGRYVTPRLGGPKAHEESRSSVLCDLHVAVCQAAIQDFSGSAVGPV